VTPRRAAGSKRRKTPPSAAKGGASEVERAPAARGKRSSAALYGLAAALLPLLFFWHTTRFGFLLDDFVLYQSSPSLAEPGSVATGFHLDVGAVRKGSDTPLGGYYRPVFLALSTLYYQAVGGQPAAWHAAAVVLAALVAALAFALLRRLGFEPRVALLATLAFALHPSHVSSIAWASGLQELLAAFLLLLALLALLASPGAAHDRRAVVLASAAYVLALLSKEVAVGLLPLAAVWWWARRADAPAESRRFSRATLAFAAITALYLALRWAVFGALAKPWPHAPAFVASVPSLPVAFATYLQLLLWPAGFSIFRPERPVWHALDGRVLITVAVLAALAVGAAAAVRRRRELVLPLAWFVAWLLPVLNLWALDPQLMVSDRYLFLPALALPWLLALVLPRRLVLPALALAALAGGALALRYAAIFHDEAAFVAAMERAEPTSPLILAEKARLLQRDGKPTLAEAALERVVELEPWNASSHISLGDLALQRGDFTAAEAHYRAALADQPWASKPWKLLAIALAQAGETSRAAALLAESAARWPEDAQLQLLHAVELARRGDRAAAELAFAAAERARPGDPQLAGGLDGALERLGALFAPRRP
jgi:Flp pilus assembly protein TadD